MKQLFIALPEFFSFKECLKFLRRSRMEVLFKVTDGKIQILLPVNGKLFFLEISEHSEQELEIACSDTPDAYEAVSIRNYVTNWLDLGTRLKPFYEKVENDPLLGPVITRYPGLRLIGIPDLFEALAWSVIGQQINLNFAYSLKKQLVEKYGNSEKFYGQLYYTFPEPPVIARLTIEELKKIQFSRQKADYLIGIARLMDEGKLSEAELRNVSFENAKAELVRIRGIGNWSANYVLMKCIRHPQAFPVEDVGLHNAIKKELGLKQKPTIEEVKKMAAHWGNWKAYATFYLWHSLLDESR